jgi:hypothetical protein
MVEFPRIRALQHFTVTNLTCESSFADLKRQIGARMGKTPSSFNRDCCIELKMLPKSKEIQGRVGTLRSIGISHRSVILVSLWVETGWDESDQEANNDED